MNNGPSDGVDGIGLLYDDDHLAIVDKEPGVPVQSDRTGTPCLLDLVRTAFPGKEIGLPHRLDRPVSGLVVFAKHKEALRGMDTLFREGTVTKDYLAIVEGVTEPRGELVHRLVHKGGQRKAWLEPLDGDGARDSRPVRLHYTKLAEGERYSLLKVRPERGAFHQIRAQLAASGHPIKGDVKYGARRGERDRGIALHAWRLRFVHPVTGGLVEVEAPVPQRSIWPLLWPLVRREDR